MKPSAAEATLNWQSENALAQSQVLKRVDSKITHVDSITVVQAKVDNNTKMVNDLINLLQKMLNDVAKEPTAPGQYFFSHLAQREKEIQNLKDQIKTLQETRKIPPPSSRSDAVELFPSIRQQQSSLPTEGVRITFPEFPKRIKPSTYEIYLEIKKTKRC